MFDKKIIYAVICSAALVSCSTFYDDESADDSKVSLQEKSTADKATAKRKAEEKDQQAKASVKKAEQEKAAKASAKKAEPEKLANASALKAQQQKARNKAEQEKLAKAAAIKAQQEKAAKKEKAAKSAAKKAEQEKAQLAASKKAEQARARLMAARAAAAAERAATPGARPIASKHSGSKTPLGADASGNSVGTIPSWTGKMRGTPKGIRYNGSGDIRPDPYAKEQPIFTIHAGNVNKYAGKLSAGQQQLFKKYPDSFYMHIYPSHRDGRYSKLWEDRTAYNAIHTKLANGGDGLRGYTGGVPFPNPKNGAEAIWNGRISHPQSTVVGVMDDMAVYLNGNTQLRRQKLVSEYPFSSTKNKVGETDEEISVNAAYVHITVEQPRRKKDEMVIVHEAVDQVKNDRKAWAYIPGARRVRRAPTVGFDTPDGPGGLVTVDDSLGFNGALNRFNWKLVGKKEIYIPYHNYKFDNPKVSYKNLLQKGHANPDYMRYELHRVWIVEATLKNGKRHVYGKRRFYMDEDSWQIVLVDSYDGRGDLWRAGILNTVYDYAVQGYVNRAQIFHDFQNGAYIAMRLINETAPVNLMAKAQGEKYYTPSNLRKLGK